MSYSVYISKQPLIQQVEPACKEQGVCGDTQTNSACRPVANAGGYPGSPYFKIVITGTDRTLAATADGEVIAVPAFTGAPEQLWRIDQLTDGTYRIMPMVVPDSTEPLALTAVGASTPTLASFDPKSDKARWNFKKP